MSRNDLRSVFGGLGIAIGQADGGHAEDEADSLHDSAAENAAEEARRAARDRAAGLANDIQNVGVTRQFDVYEILKRVPIFSGAEDLEDWLFKVKTIVDTHPRREKEIFQTIHFRLGGKAAQFYRMEADNIKTLSNLVSLFTIRFLGVDEAAVETAYTNCAQAKDESVMDYSQRFQAIASRLYGKHQGVGPIQRGIIRQFVCGLNSDIRRWVSSKPLDSLTDAIAAAVWEENAVAMTKRRGAGENSEKLLTALEQTLEKIQSATKKLGLDEDDDDSERSLLQAFIEMRSKGSEKSQAGACFKCGGIGHIKAECPSKIGTRESQPSNGRAVTRCTHCNKIGHGADDCFILRFGVAKRQPGVKCEHCGRDGHSTHDCYLKKAQESRSKHTDNKGPLNSNRS